MLTRATPIDWVLFACVVAGALVADVLLFGRHRDRMSFREAALRSAFWVAAGLGFTLWVWKSFGADDALRYLAAYVIEKSLSVDNLFVFLVIFNYFGVRTSQQQRALLWGVGGAIVMRFVFILAGTALLSRFHFMMYVFGAILIYSGIKLALHKDSSVDPESNFALKLARRHLRTTDAFDGDRFFTKVNGVRHATPLFLVLLVIEFTDVVFAVDSVPAVLAISTDVFVVYTSNLFAILGLRALYFLLAGMMSRFHYLDLGLAMILIFIGVKMAVADWVKIPILVSLAVIAGVLTLSVVASLLRPAPPHSLPDE
ncbi:MAG TPA: TerC family protein [Polyangiaceae bacterium]|nr:TerC family protein [Polyangiaceae bacterium]